MTNLPPPDPRSSGIGLDELVGMIVALGTIGTILFMTLSPKDKGFNLSRFINSSATDPTTQVTGEQTPTAPLSSVTPQETSSPKPTASETSTSVLPATPLPASPAAPVSRAGTAQRAPKVVPIALVPSASRAEAPTETSPSPNVKAVKFADVPENLWARPYIDGLSQRGFMKGSPDGSFKPSSTVTRGEFAVLLQKTFEREPKSKAPQFKDVSPNFWASPAIQESAETAFLRGYPRNIFRPNQPITKVEVLVALASGLGLTPNNTSKEVLKTYKDADQIPKYAIGKVSAATKAGIVVNYPNSQLLNPNRNITRAEVSALVYQALVKAGKAKPIASKYAVKP